jgi:hypothetical protein
MPHKRSSHAILKRRIRKIVLRASYWDKKRGECISMIDAEILGIIRGEVLHDSRGHLSPSLHEDG